MGRWLLDQQAPDTYEQPRVQVMHEQPQVQFAWDKWDQKVALAIERKLWKMIQGVLFCHEWKRGQNEKKSPGGNCFTELF